MARRRWFLSRYDGRSGAKRALSTPGPPQRASTQRPESSASTPSTGSVPCVSHHARAPSAFCRALSWKKAPVSGSSGASAGQRMKWSSGSSSENSRSLPALREARTTLRGEWTIKHSPDGEGNHGWVVRPCVSPRAIPRGGPSAPHDLRVPAAGPLGGHGAVDEGAAIGEEGDLIGPFMALQHHPDLLPGAAGAGLQAGLQ